MQMIFRRVYSKMYREIILIIVNESLTLPSGIEVSGYYASLGDQSRITSEKRVEFNSSDASYRVEGVFTFWKDKSQSIGNKFISVSSSTPQTDDVYSKCFTDDII